MLLLPPCLTRPHFRYWLLPLLVLLFLLPNSADAQLFDANRYLQNCLEFERGGDFETARQSCLNALASDPDLAQARLALGRIELALGNLAAAESNLQQARRQTDSPEPLLLLADLMIRSKRFDEAESVLREAAGKVQGSGSSWAARHAYLEGVLEESRGNFTEALDHFREAVRLEPGNRDYLLRLASLYFEMGEADEAQAALQSYIGRSAGADPEVTSLLGRTYWAGGDLEAAATELERALALRTARGGGGQARDLRALALVYYGLGDYEAGGLALREAMLRGNPLETFFSGNLPWLLLLLFLLAVHLVGESRIGATSSADTGEGPRIWSVGQVYGIGWAGLLCALPVAVAYGYFRYENLLSLVTPVQNSDTLAIFFVVFSLVVAVGAWRRTALNGWSPGPALLGGSERVPAGILLGLALLAATIAYRLYVPEGPFRDDYFLDLAHLTPAVAAAMLLLPLSEIFFRPFAFTAFENRYGSAFAVLISGGLSALLFATPLLLLLAIGLVLAAVYRSTRSGALTLAAQFTLHVGLLAGILLFPLLRSLFV
ncbi:MAG TPA: tetratricopeptide repeat protein [Trueperaceae bacterium]